MIKGSALQLDYLTRLLIWYLKCLLFGEKNNRQLSIGRKLCKTVRFFTESWRVFTWKDHQRTDLLSSSSVTSKGLNRLRSSAGYFIGRQLQWILSRGERKSAYPSYKFCGNYFYNGNNEDKAEDKALQYLRNFHLLFGWLTVTWWRSSLLKILYSTCLLPLKKTGLTPFETITNNSFLL